jgi:hypothetical protein
MIISLNIINKVFFERKIMLKYYLDELPLQRVIQHTLCFNPSMMLVIEIKTTAQVRYLNFTCPKTQNALTL